MYYCPFKDNHGNDIDFDAINYNNLSELVNFEEGYKLEYKGTYGTETKNKLPKIVSSFANSSGGWLFIGIENNTKNIIDVDKPSGEIELNIINIIKNFVDLEVVNLLRAKFLENPNSPNKGVIAVFIDEGLHPPYISNGTVYVRSGAQSEPVKAERFTIDNLYKKSEKTSLLQLRGIVNNQLCNFFENKHYTHIENIKKIAQDLNLKIITKLNKLNETIPNKTGWNIEYEAIKSKGLLASFLGEKVSLEKNLEDVFTTISEFVNYSEINVNLDNVFQLGDLILCEKMNLSSLRNQIDAYGTIEEKSKYEELKQVSKDITTLLNLMPLCEKFSNSNFILLALTNVGNNYDEDINLRIFVPKDSFCNLSDLSLVNEMKEYNQKLLKAVTDFNVAGTDDYDNNLPFSRPSPPMQLMPGYYTKSEETYKTEILESEIKGCYSNLEIQPFNEKLDLIKISFKKLIPNQVQLLPAPLILSADIDELNYEIMSKFSSKKIIQTLKKTS